MALCFYNFNSRTRAIGKTSGFQTRKTITAWWLALNLRSMLLAMECQINEVESRALIAQRTWIALDILW